MIKYNKQGRRLVHKPIVHPLRKATPARSGWYGISGWLCGIGALIGLPIAIVVGAAILSPYNESKSPPYSEVDKLRWELRQDAIRQDRTLRDAGFLRYSDGTYRK